MSPHDFWPVANNVRNKGKSAIPLPFKSLEVLSTASDKAKLFQKPFKKPSLADAGISLSAFPSRTNLKLYVSVRPMSVKRS